MYKTLFLEKAILGRKTDFDNPDEVILQCIKLAYRDMLTAGRYYITNDMDLCCENFKSILENNHYVYSREIIEETLLLFGMKEKIGNDNKYVTAYGLAQKLVNMTYKYLYIFSAYIDKNIDFSNCDCPLDSIILGKLQYNGHVWSKITKDEYIYCQQMITDCLQQENLDLDDELAIIGNLAFDFLNW